LFLSLSIKERKIFVTSVYGVTLVVVVVELVVVVVVVVQMQ